MPSSLFTDHSVHGGFLDEQRGLHKALDQLSLLSPDNEENSVYDSQESRKRSGNMTECVPVPSSEHVAEIVGRQGCKIQALRAKTNTYIKTPVRGEEPVFVVTGRREDVALARREIISAAEHFSLIRTSRNKNSSMSGGTTIPGPPNLPGQTTITVRVPYRVVGLVVGPKGTTIKRIQQQTHTFIVTPSREKEPVFEVTGMPENVDRAREEIESHISVRTGGIIELRHHNDFHANGTDVSIDSHGQAYLWSKSSGEGTRTSATRTSVTPTSEHKSFSSYRNDSFSSLGSLSTDSCYGNNSPHMADYSPPSPALSFTSSNCDDDNDNTNRNLLVYRTEVMSPDGVDSLFVGSSPTSTLTTFPSNNPINANVLNARRTDDGFPPPPLYSQTANHPLARSTLTSLSGCNLYGDACSPSVVSSSCSCSSSSCSSSSSTSRKGSRDCSLCFESEVIAALVPCGHNLFCMECADRICERSEPRCPVCNTCVTQAIRILS